MRKVDKSSVVEMRWKMTMVILLMIRTSMSTMTMMNITMKNMMKMIDKIYLIVPQPIMRGCLFWRDTILIPISF